MLDQGIAMRRVASRAQRWGRSSAPMLRIATAIGAYLLATTLARGPSVRAAASA